MSVLRNVELVVAYGNFYKCQLPLAASQTLKAGEPFYLNSGRVTRVAATTETIDTGDDMLGWVAEDAQVQANGATTSKAVDTLINCILWTRNIFWNLPTYNGTPAITNLTTAYAGYNDAGVYKIDIGNTTNPVFRAFSFDLMDARGGAQNKWKSTFSTGDRLLCVGIDASFKQVAF